MKKMIVSGIAAVAVAGGIALAAPAQAEGSFVTCGYGYGVEGNSTTCTFAYNVRGAVNSGHRPILAYSPATDMVYEMECGSTSVSIEGGAWVSGLRCAGGNNAVVILW